MSKLLQTNQIPATLKIFPVPTIFDISLQKHVKELTDKKTSSCYQCQKCTNGCPAAYAMDLVPHQLINMVNIGQISEAINSNAIWLCTSCKTCTTFCPNGIDIAHVMDCLKRFRQRNIYVSQKSNMLFHSAFLSSIRMFGRVHELSMVIIYTIRDKGIKGLIKQAGLGLNMLAKGKLKLIPDSNKSIKQIRDIFKATVDTER